MHRALAPAALVIALAPAMAAGQAPPATSTAPVAATAPVAPSAPARLASATADRAGARMVLRAEYRLLAPVAGPVPVRWRAFAGSRTARRLPVVARGVRQVTAS
ncbi:MAG: hypothetical protein ISP32_02825, partial [Thermoleophilia bacterium]|nr:hypothetical protein [Thermoleophilia bacterium]